MSFKGKKTVKENESNFTGHENRSKSVSYICRLLTLFTSNAGNQHV